MGQERLSVRGDNSVFRFENTRIPIIAIVLQIPLPPVSAWEGVRRCWEVKAEDLYMDEG